MAIKQETQTPFRRQMIELRKKQRAATRKWQQLKQASGQDWEKIKAETEAAIHELERAYDEIVSRLGRRKEG